VNINQLEVDRHQVDVEHRDPALKRVLQMRLENWTTLLLDYWEIDRVFRVNISTNDIDL
jgi:hypothetical protein